MSISQKAHLNLSCLLTQRNTQRCIALPLCPPLGVRPPGAAVQGAPARFGSVPSPCPAAGLQRGVQQQLEFVEITVNFPRVGPEDLEGGSPSKCFAGVIVASTAMFFLELYYYVFLQLFFSPPYEKNHWVALSGRKCG